MKRFMVVPVSLSLSSSRNAMVTAQQRLSVLSHNISNIQSTGFKEQLVSQKNSRPRQGTPELSTSLDTSQGPLRSTGRTLDLTVAGEGFLPLQTREGTGYVSSGQFHVDVEGNVVHSASGNQLLGQNGPVELPGERSGSDVSIAANGKITTKSGSWRPIAQLTVATFQNPAGLIRDGNGMLFESANTGEPAIGVPGRAGAGDIQSGILEQSNVELTGETIEMMNTQSAFRLNARHLRVQNQMLRRAATLV